MHSGPGVLSAAQMVPEGHGGGQTGFQLTGNGSGTGSRARSIEAFRYSHVPS